MTLILISTILLAILGLLIGLFLGFASEIFKVYVDDRIVKVRDVLPGNNCGGCGYPGCDGCAVAIVKGEAKPNACPVGGEKIADEISKIIGVEIESGVKQVAYVHCNGTCVNSEKTYNYIGEKDCRIASIIPNKGEKSCKYACMGYGTCVNACRFDAIHIIDGVAKVDKEKCVGCKACIKACPMNLISLVHYDKNHHIACNNKDKGPNVMKVCKVSCIACGICEKNCPTKAISILDNIPIIDYSKCSNCGTCAEKCPRNLITK